MLEWNVSVLLVCKNAAAPEKAKKNNSYALHAIWYSNIAIEAFSQLKWTN